MVLEKELKRTKRLVGELMMTKNSGDAHRPLRGRAPFFRSGGRIREPGMLGLRAARLWWGPGVPAMGRGPFHPLRPAGAGGSVPPRPRGRKPILPDEGLVTWI